MSDRTVFAVIVGLVAIAVVALVCVAIVDINQGRAPMAIINVLSGTVPALIATLAAYNSWRTSQKTTDIETKMTYTNGAHCNLVQQMETLHKAMHGLEKRMRASTDHAEGE